MSGTGGHGGEGGAGTGGGAGAGGTGGGAGAGGTGGATAGSAGAAGRGGSGGGSGGNPFAGATPLTVGGSPTSGTLASATNAQNAYSFSGTQGELIQIATTTGTMPFDPADLDLVVTVYDPSQQRLARALHPWPWVTNAPTLFTVLPATGTYYIAVENCLAILATECRASTPIVNRGYTIRVSDLSGPTLIREGNEPANDDAAGAPALSYTKAGGPSYAPLLLFGLFQSASDRDTYSFTIPADVPVAAGARARANFWIQPSGGSGNGSTASSGPVYVIDTADTSGAHLADLDSFQFGSQISNTTQPASLSFPVTPGKAYRLVFTHTSSLQPGSNGFYFIQHQVGAGAEAPAVEMEPNDTLAMAESLAALSNSDGTSAFTVDGDLTTAETDVDFYHLVLPSGVTTVSGACLSRLLGSGVGSLSYGLVDSSGTLLRVQTEVGNAFHAISQAIPAGGLTLKVSATIQIAGITGNSYTCRFVAAP